MNTHRRPTIWPVSRIGNNGTNETDGFFRQARRRPAAALIVRQGAATTHGGRSCASCAHGTCRTLRLRSSLCGGKRRRFMFRYFRFATLVITLLSLASLLAGCGQKGPLHLPDETPVATQQK